MYICIHICLTLRKNIKYNAHINIITKYKFFLIHKILRLGHSLTIDKTKGKRYG